MPSLSRRALMGTSVIAGLALGAPRAAFGAPLSPGERRQLQPTGDLLISTSFEVGEEDQGWLSAATSYDDTIAHSGERSLRYDRATVTSPYVLAQVSLPAVAGTRYEVTAQVRTANLTGSTSPGGRVAIDGWSSANSWMGGGYAVDVRSGDWTVARAEYLAPEGINRISVAAYLQKGVAGTAWFDDLQVRVIPPLVLSSELRAPSYQGLLFPDDHSDVRLLVRCGLAEVDLATHTLGFEIIDQADAVVVSEVAPAAAVVEFGCAATDLGLGEHVVRAHLVNSADEVVATQEWGIEKLAQAPDSYLDRHGRLVRNGELFFPIGMFNDRIDQRSLDDLAGTPFNTLLPYTPHDAAALDLAQTAGMAIIYSLKDFFHDSSSGAKPAEIVTEADEVPVIQDRVTALRDHPALLSWYLADERPESFHDRMGAHYDAITGLDRDHPVYVVHNNAPEPAENYLRFSDVVGIDSYPVRGLAGERIDQPSMRASVAAGLLPTRPMWHVPQSFGGDALHRAGWSGPFPSLVELRNMTWQFVCHGATGLVYWELLYMRSDPQLSFAEALEIASTVAQEVADVAAILLSVEPSPPATLPDEPWLDVLAKSYDGDGHVFAVNHDKSQRSASFTIPSAVQVQVEGEGRTIELSAGGTFTDSFDSLDVRHYRVTVASFDSLSQLTGELFGAQRGQVTVAVKLLERAKTSAARGDMAAVAVLVANYQKFVARQAGDGLSQHEADRLIRLSEFLLSA